MKMSVLCQSYQGTVTPAGQNFDPEDAAERLHKAMKGLGNSFSSTLTFIVIALFKNFLITLGDKITKLRRFEQVFISKLRKIEKGTTSLYSHALRFEDVLSIKIVGVSRRQERKAIRFRVNSQNTLLFVMKRMMKDHSAPSSYPDIEYGADLKIFLLYTNDNQKLAYYLNIIN